MTKFILRWIINALALYAAFFIVKIDFQGGWTSVIWLALIFGFVNALLRPLLKLLTCPLIILTLGLFTLLINTFLFRATGAVGGWFGIGFDVTFGQAFWGGVIVSLVSIVMSLILKDELKKR